MYRVMIVDDEIWTVKGIKASCNWEEMGCIIVYDTISPIEALNYLEHNPVDIVLVDINMDEMNGLELIREARLKGCTAEFIIISGYSEFEYARSALQYGVFDYILKPVDRQVLRNAISNLMKFMELNKEVQVTTNNLERIINANLRDAEALFKEQKRHLQYDGFQAIIIEDVEALDYIKEHLIQTSQVFISYTLGKNKYLLFINTPEDISPIFLSHEGVKMGISNYSKEQSSIDQLYYEADVAFCNNLIQHPKVYKFAKHMNKGDGIIHNLIVGKGPGYTDYVQQLSESREEYSIEEFTLLYNSTVAWCNYTHVHHGPYSYVTYDEIYRTFKDIDELVAYLMDMVKSLLEEAPLMDSEDHANMAEILDYIHANYKTNIYLSDLAGQFFYNQSYISSLFKKHLDKTFTEYLKELRMRKACHLLVNTDSSITDISNEVGYSDYCYFSKIFKKTYGMTPLQYRKNIYKGQGDVS